MEPKTWTALAVDRANTMGLMRAMRRKMNCWSLVEILSELNVESASSVEECQSHGSRSGSKNESICRCELAVYTKPYSQARAQTTQSKTSILAAYAQCSDGMHIAKSAHHYNGA